MHGRSLSSAHTLRDSHVLIIEDEFYVADELKRLLQDEGAVVIGPVASVEGAIAEILRNSRIDAAMLDVNLRGVMAFPVADLLADRKIPFVFATGYDRAIIPRRFRNVVYCAKPIQLRNVVRAIGRIVH